eukprot:m.153937 g.153937  ORF g.153937 m.153937 type:complete len:146 (+) comp9785_c0_seq2:984-1421(+)
MANQKTPGTLNFHLRKEYHGEGAATQAADSFVRWGLIGAGAGAVQSAWTTKAEVDLKTLPILAKTAGNIGRLALTFGAVAAVHRGTDVALRDEHGHRTFKSSATAGAVSGALLAIPFGSLRSGLLGSAALAAVSVAAYLNNNEIF